MLWTRQPGLDIAQLDLEVSKNIVSKNENTAGRRHPPFWDVAKNTTSYIQDIDIPNWIYRENGIVDIDIRR